MGMKVSFDGQANLYGWMYGWDFYRNNFLAYCKIIKREEKHMRERKKRWKRFLAGMLSGVMLAGTVGGELPAATVDAAGENVAAGEISVNPQIHYQTLKGWGLSLIHI